AQATRPTKATSATSATPSSAPARRSQPAQPAPRAAAVQRPAQWPATAGGSTRATKLAGRPSHVGTPPTASNPAASADPYRTANPNPRATPPSSRPARQKPCRWRTSARRPAAASKTASSQFTPLLGLLQQGQKLPVLGPQPLHFVGQVNSRQNRDPVAGHVAIGRLQLAKLGVHQGRHLFHVLGRRLAPQHVVFVTDAHLHPVFHGCGRFGRGHASASLPWLPLLPLILP